MYPASTRRHSVGWISRAELQGGGADVVFDSSIALLKDKASFCWSLARGVAAPPPSTPAQSVLLIFANLGNRLAVVPALTLCFPMRPSFHVVIGRECFFPCYLTVQMLCPSFFSFCLFLVDIKELLAH